MTRYGRSVQCDQCETIVYEGDFIKTFGGAHYCEECWRSLLETELFYNYIPNHKAELLLKVQEELEEL